MWANVQADSLAAMLVFVLLQFVPINKGMVP